MPGYRFDVPHRMERLLRNEPDAPAWVERLPSIVDACVERWDLMPEPPFTDSNASLVLPVTRRDGSEAVLKINIPNIENEQEHAALQHWDGHGAVRLFDFWEERSALLIERCRPGAQLWSIEDDEEATRIFISVVRRAMKPVSVQHPFRLLADEAIRWAEEIPIEYETAGASFDRRILDEVVEGLRAFGADQGPQIVLHQDLHGGNILQSEREPWLIIDAKPLVGELEFDMTSYLRDRRWTLAAPDAQRVVQRRLDLMAEELPIDRERARFWGMAHCIAWGLEDGGMRDEFRRALELIWRCE